MLAKAKTRSDDRFTSGTNRSLPLLASKGELKNKEHFTNRKNNKNNTERGMFLSNKIFDYIYVALCQRLFLFTCYKDITYAI